MRINYYESNNYIGIFYVDDEEYHGELTYNRDTGKITLELKREIDLNMAEANDPESDTYKELGKKCHRIAAIPGKLDEGNSVALFNCRCTGNIINGDEFSYSRTLQFQAEYMIWNDPDAIGRKYSKLIFVLENALRWSQLTQINCTEGDIVKFDPIKDCPRFNWFGAKITFSTFLNYDTISPYKENTQITERLAIAIQVKEDRDVGYFLDVRNKIMALISYGIRDNLNIVRQYLSQRDDIVKYPEGLFSKKDKEYSKYDLLTSEPYHIVDEKFENEYNFTLPQLPQDGDFPDKLERITPVFNLYLSLFKYRDMPPEMVFLNMIQALETFHARFYFGEEDGIPFQTALFEKYKESDNHPTPPEYFVNGVLIPKFVFGGDFDKKKRKPNLIPRVKHMLVSAEEELFIEFCKNDGKVAQQIVKTRNYYTHYGEGREHTAASGNDLEMLTEFVAFVLGYYVNEVLGIKLDRTPAVIDEETQIDLCEYARYMRKLKEKRDYFAAYLPLKSL